MEEPNPDIEPVQASVPERIKSWYRALPDKKRYIEFITAILTVPVLLTVIINNVSNLNRQKQMEMKPPTSAGTSSTQPNTTPANDTNGHETPTASPTMNPVSTAQCKKQVGPVAITSPKENDIITSDPVCLDITRSEADQYCAVVWSYRINSGSWSEYTDKSICMYGLTPGKKSIDLRVKSIASGEETVLTRNFIVAGTPSPAPAVSSPSATPAQ